MNQAQCNFCGESFRNAQAVRAHLKACPAYRQVPKADVPRERSALGANPLTALVAGTSSPQIQASDGPRRQGTAERGPHGATDRDRRDAAERELRQRRREIIQRVKGRVIESWWSSEYTIPSEVKAQALIEIEKALSNLAVEEFPESELVTIAEGIRARMYQSVMQAQDQAREEARKRAELIEHGVAYAIEALRQETWLDPWTRVDIAQKVKRALEEEVSGKKSKADVETLVEDVLDDELEAAEEKKRKKARPKLITHGVAYARRELTEEPDLDVWDQWDIERDVKNELEREITGDESQRDVEVLVDEILDDMLGEAETDEDAF